MPVSAELRWFWPSRPPIDLREWFCDSDTHPYPAGGGGVRADRYLLDAEQTELGFKRRGREKEIEIKGLIRMAPEIGIAPFTGPVEIWIKWTSGRLKLDLASTLVVRKQRWLRKFDTSSPTAREIELDSHELPAMHHPLPPNGCNVELTKLRLPNEDVWWTLGFEAFGNVARVERSLGSVVSAIVARHPPPLSNGIPAGYPKWLSEFAPTR